MDSLHGVKDILYIACDSYIYIIYMLGGALQTSYEYNEYSIS